MPMKSLTIAAVALLMAQATPQFGGGYAGLGARRQKLVDDWITRFNQVTGQKLAAAEFYDSVLRTSTKTTFDAVTHALMTTSLTDASGARLGDGLDLIEHLDTVRGAFKDTKGDQQFRMYVRLTERAVDMLTRSQEFKRGADNTVYHKGYPANYRQQGGAPSIQISVALDGRRADVDVDYRSSGFPAVIFNGHLTAANSDVRAGDNSDRHSTRWAGFQNWWRSFFGVPLKSAPDDSSAASALLPSKPRAGDKPIDVMVQDFLTAWLVEGNISEAMGYVAPPALTCLALDEDDPETFDRGMAPFKLMLRMKAAFDALGPHSSLNGLTLGVRLANPALRVVQQPHHAQVVIYSVPEDVAASFDCQSQLTAAAPAKASRSYGKYHGAVFHLNVPGGRDHTMALLWARDGGFWKLVSWRAEADDDTTRPLHTTPDVKTTRVPADATLVAAARGFLENWLIRKNYDAAFQAFSPASYACYDLTRPAGEPPSTSPEDAGRRIRAGLERAGNALGQRRDLGAVVFAAEPTHPAVRVMDHPSSKTFSLSSLPDTLTAAATCSARAAGTPYTPAASDSYGRGFGMTLEFRTESGEAPVVRILWVKEAAGWRIAAYDVEHP
jgi:hypothetical protein